MSSKGYFKITFIIILNLLPLEDFASRLKMKENLIAVESVPKFFFDHSRMSKDHASETKDTSNYKKPVIILSLMRLQTLIRTETGQTVIRIVVAVALLQLIFPQISLAEKTNASSIISAQVNSEQGNILLANSNETLPIADVEEKNTDEIALRKQMLDKYFTEVRPSPKFAAATQTLAEQPHYRKVIAIAFVESTLGKHCYFNNCWGISPGGKLAKYTTLDEGIIAHNGLIDRRYNGWTYERMNGVYVVPKNPNWLRGVYQIEAELDALEKEFSISNQVATK